MLKLYIQREINNQFLILQKKKKNQTVAFQKHTRLACL